MSDVTVQQIVEEMRKQNYQSVFDAQQQLILLLKQGGVVIRCKTQATEVFDQCDEQEFVTLYLSQNPNNDDDIICAKGKLDWDFDDYLAGKIPFVNLSFFELVEI